MFSHVKSTKPMIKGSKNVFEGYIGVRLLIFSKFPAVYKPVRFLLKYSHRPELTTAHLATRQ